MYIAHRILNDIKISFILHFSLSQVNSFEAIENARKIHCMRKKQSTTAAMPPMMTTFRKPARKSP